MPKWPSPTSQLNILRMLNIIFEIWEEIEYVKTCVMATGENGCAQGDKQHIHSINVMTTGENGYDIGIGEVASACTVIASEVSPGRSVAADGRSNTSVKHSKILFTST